MSRNHEFRCVCHEIPRSQNSGVCVTKFHGHEIPVCVSRNSTVTKFRCVRHEMIVYVSRNSGPHQPMGRGLTPALRRSRGIGAEIAISQHDHCSRRPPLRVGSPPEASTAVCMHTTDVTVIATTDNCHRYRHHRNKAALQVCALWRRVCLNAPTSAHTCVSVLITGGTPFARAVLMMLRSNQSQREKVTQPEW